jgi:hypothetical protein
MKRPQKLLIMAIAGFVSLLMVLFVFWLLELRKPLNEVSAPNSPVKTTQSAAANQPISSQSNAVPSLETNLPAATNAMTASLASGASATNAPGQDGQISASALKQIAALEAVKAKRTPTQQKIDSQLLYADMMRRGVPIADGVPTQRVDLDNDDQGRVLVDIKAEVTDALLQYIKSIGGNVVNDFPQYQAIRAGVPLANIEDLAARGEVKFVEPAVRAMNNTVDSEGDYTHQATNARTTFGVNGTGVKVGVLSGDVEYLNSYSSQIAGKVTVLSGQSGTTTEGEGTAMLEIVNDLAPGAQLYFATAASSEASFANNIQQLQAAGCNIIVDDELWPDESPFQDGIVAQAVNSVTANGVLYFSAAANSGNKDDGTSGTWEGDFVDSGDINDSLLPANSGHVHSFDGGMLFDKITTNGPAGNDLTTVLFWSDPLGASTNDYDLYLLDPTGSSVVASSTNPQNGTQDPYEHVPNSSSTTNPAVGDLIVIVKFSGAGRFLHLSTGRGELAISTQGSTRGHDCATNAFDVAATDANNSYPFAFSGGAANPVETFSSDGPRRVFFQANGTPITPGNFSSTGGAVRQKPDITAADGVKTDLPAGNLNPFHGTSAAAPHAAAIAALLKSYNTNLTASQIRMVLTNTALDIMAPGWDRDSGAGIVMALAALQASPLPNLAKFTDNLNNSSPHTGDVVTASITITNQPCSNGGTSAGAFHVGFYGLSTTPSFTGLSAFYELRVNGCAANGTVSTNLNITISAGTTPGIYYLGYKIDDENEVNECNGGDNGIYYWTITVLPPPQPDLTLGTATLNTSSPPAGDTITASLTITNEACTGGSANAGTFHVGFYGLSTTTSFTGLSPFYELQVNGCAAYGSVSTNLNIIISPATAPGTYYLGFKIDDENEVNECNEGNNGFYYWPLTVQSTNIAQITLATVPTSLLVSVDSGSSVAAPLIINWTSGSTHTIATFTGQLSADSHTRYNFSSWSDAGAQSHSVTPVSSGTYTAYFSTNYWLNTTASPLNGGVVTNNPLGPWYNPGVVVRLTANPAGGYVLSSWMGEDSYSNNLATVTMNGYRNVTANFSVITAPIFGCASAASGQLKTTLSGLLAGETVILQVSTNLQTWTPIQTNNANGSVLSITNTINPSTKSQFFRATVQ